MRFNHTVVKVVKANQKEKVKNAIAISQQDRPQNHDKNVKKSWNIAIQTLPVDSINKNSKKRW